MDRYIILWGNFQCERVRYATTGNTLADIDMLLRRKGYRKKTARMKEVRYYENYQELRWAKVWRNDGVMPGGDA